MSTCTSFASSFFNRTEALHFDPGKSTDRGSLERLSATHHFKLYSSLVLEVTHT